MICNKCGHQANEGATFCNKCGDRFNMTSPGLPPQIPNNKVTIGNLLSTVTDKQSRVLVIVVAVVIVAVSTFGIIIAQSNKNTPSAPQSAPVNSSSSIQASNSLIGNWIVIKFGDQEVPDGTEIVFSFESGGGFVMWGYGGGETMSETGTWRMLDGSQLHIAKESGTGAFIYEINGNELEITGMVDGTPDLSTKMIFSRKLSN